MQNLGGKQSVLWGIRKKRIDYNGVGALRGQRYILSKN